MILQRSTPPAVEDQDTVKAEYARFLGTVLRGIVLVVAMCAFVDWLAGFLYGGKGDAALLVFAIASIALCMIAPKPETLPEVEGEGTKKARRLRLPDWSLVAYCVITGVGYTWVCVFLWFSRRYALFSGPVVGLVGLIFVFCAEVGLLVALMTGRNWRTALLISLLVPNILSVIILRLHLLR